MANEFTSTYSIIESSGDNWSITNTISYSNMATVPPSPYFSFTVATLVPKTLTVEQSTAKHFLNCKEQTQIQYDIWNKATTADWVASMYLPSYLNKTVKV